MHSCDFTARSLKQKSVTRASWDLHLRSHIHQKLLYFLHLDDHNLTKRRQTRPSDYGSPESQEVLILIH
ncbi:MULTISPECIES: hypothetical protein [Fischerella]|uniref:hypothetical protein n=1 Tax=Fischerella TaxID=1190 RepID=UPI0015C02B7B|nr:MULTISPECIES: hypothetical protein [Fischerella]